MQPLKSLTSGVVIVNGISVGNDPIDFEDNVIAQEDVQESIKRGEIEVVKKTTTKSITDKKLTIVTDKKETVKAKE